MKNPAAVLELQYPITRSEKDEVIERFEFRRVKLRDLNGLPKDDLASTVELLSRLTGQPPSVIQEMDAMDMEAAAKIIEGFLPKSRKDGKQSLAGLPTE